MSFIKLNVQEVARSAKAYKWTRARSIAAHQVAVYVMCGGGFLGSAAAHRPADFYIDDRCGKLPYPRREIEQAVKCLAVIAEAAGMNSHKLPEMARFHNCGIF